MSRFERLITLQFVVVVVLLVGATCIPLRGALDFIVSRLLSEIDMHGHYRKLHILNATFLRVVGSLLDLVRDCLAYFLSWSPFLTLLASHMLCKLHRSPILVQYLCLYPSQ